MWKPEWWKTATIYQIYPRSFQDANGDGVGDLRGIIERLPYLSELGIDAIWISPIYPSPMADFGYDVADYVGIDPLFGTMEDFDLLISRAHGLGLRVLLDLVPNHTSDKHPWFLESRASRENVRRDWYIWRDPAPDGEPPNNWKSEFGGSAWEFDAQTGQYYYHAFLSKQPDLNWRNPAVRNAMYDVMRFWLRKGVDGFRVDVIWHLLKDELFRDNPVNPDYHPGLPPHRSVTPLYTTDLPQVHEVVAGLRRVIDEFDNRLLIGEIYLPIEKLVAYYGHDPAGVHLPFNFSLLEAPWNAPAIAKLIDEYETALPTGAWPNWVLGNHDRPRIASRAGQVQARVAAMLLLTLRGTPTIYYGDEIGMSQTDVPESHVQDPLEKNCPGFGIGRDGARTPMQWDNSKFAGFSSKQPWLPIGHDVQRVNVEVQRSSSHSMLNLYTRLIKARRGSKALLNGAYRPIMAHGYILLYARNVRDESVFVALNFGEKLVRIELPAANPRGRVLVSCFGDRDEEIIDRSTVLRGNEGLVVLLGSDGASTTKGREDVESRSARASDPPNQVATSFFDG